MVRLILARRIAVQDDALGQVQAGELLSNEPIDRRVQLRRSRSDACAAKFRERCRIRLDQVVDRDGRDSKTFLEEFRLGRLAAARWANQQDQEPLINRLRLSRCAEKQRKQNTTANRPN